MARTIVHLDLDAFFVSAERLQDPSLKEKPVIIGGDSQRGVVASCSYETREYGVHSAMPMAKAKQLCPHATVVSPTRGLYKFYSKQVTELVDQYAPRWQKASIDEFYLDLSGMDRFFGQEEWMHQLKTQIYQDIGLPVSWGMGSNKTIAKIATEHAKPNGTLHIPHGEEKSFLSTLPIGELPLVGPQCRKKLLKQEISTIGELAETPKKKLINLFGKKGISLWERAQGIDKTPVTDRGLPKSISKETTFSIDKTDSSELTSVLTSLTEKVAFRLRAKNMRASCMTVKVRYSNFQTVSHQNRIPSTFTDQNFIKAVKKLFEELYNPQRAVRLVGVRLSDLQKNEYQGRIFQKEEKQKQLYETIDNVRQRFGKESIRNGENL